MKGNKLILNLKKLQDDNKNEKLNITSENFGKKKKLNFSKLKFGKNLLIDILKKSRLRKISESKSKAKNSNSSRAKIFNNTEKHLDKKNKNVNNIYKNFQDLPEMKKFHNITLEKLSDLINSNEEIDKNNCPKYKYNNLNIKIKTEENRANSFMKSIQITKKQNKKNIFTQISNNVQHTENNRYPRFINNIKFININDINLKKDNILPYLSTKLNDNTPLNKYASLSKSRKNNLQNKSNSNSKKLFMNKTSTTWATNKWLESIRDSIKKYDILHRRSRIDRLIFVIENPDGCFEENLFEERPGDKYILLKNQMKRHKYKFENIIREIKLNQKKSEYLMKKYIFDLLSRKKSIY